MISRNYTSHPIPKNSIFQPLAQWDLGDGGFEVHLHPSKPHAIEVRMESSQPADESFISLRMGRASCDMRLDLVLQVVC